MISSSTNESSRINELRSYYILDTATHRSFDELTELASDLCQTPMSLLSFTDETRQWFKSHHGIQLSEIPREIAFCTHVIDSEEFFIVNDTLLDERFCQNPLVIGAPYIRFYAAVPLITKSGAMLGTLCILDFVPRELTEHQIHNLKILASQVMDHLESFRQDRESEINQVLNNIESFRLAALGEMAGEIVHEINNPLTVIQTHTALLMHRAQNKKLSDNVVLDYCDKVLNVTNRIAKIVKGVKNLSQQEDTRNLTLVILDDIIQDSIGYCKEKFLLHNILLNYNPIPRDVKINCHPIQISQVILNLLNNSFDAIAKNVEKWIQIKVDTTKKDVLVNVIDSGNGIPVSVQEKMFNSFFTTKKNGSGTGLGLSLSMKIINLHHGQLFYDNSKQNTCFCIKLPRAC